MELYRIKRAIKRAKCKGSVKHYFRAQKIFLDKMGLDFLSKKGCPQKPLSLN